MLTVIDPFFEPTITKLLNGEYHAGGVKIKGVEYGASGVSVEEAVRELYLLIKREVW